MTKKKSKDKLIERAYSLYRLGKEYVVKAVSPDEAREKLNKLLKSKNGKRNRKA